MNALNDSLLASEVKRRRTFAIISHPDAGKTTLTEKLLLYGGAIREAGEVSAKAQKRKTVSDWMTLEKERGISVSSSVLQFDYEGLRINLLDTPGHQDFSEDTYRTLMAADSAVMLIDAAKGVEPQTIKLFQVCRMRGIPIFTFVNKMDREARESFELMEDIEKVLGIATHPVMWPIGMGPRFRGIYHRIKKEFVFFTPAAKAGQKANEEVVKVAYHDRALLKYIEEDQFDKLQEELSIIEGGLGELDRDAFLKGQISPMMFASARNNFGVGLFLDLFKDLSPGPQAKSAQPAPVEPSEPRFSAFVFKIQANMDKAHRDRLAFMRICSGKFDRNMDVMSERLGKEVRLTHSKQLLAQERTTVDEAYAGDIIGVHDPGHFQIGDTIYTGAKIKFEGIPMFSPENFGKLSIKDPMKRKQLQKGIEQLTQEGMVQMFIQPHVGAQDPILGVVGALQFEVMIHRLKEEYNVEARLERSPYTIARWIKCRDPAVKIENIDLRVPVVLDRFQNRVALFSSEWEMNYTIKNAPPSFEWSQSQPTG